MHRFSHVRWMATLAIPLVLIMAACQPIHAPAPEVPAVVSGSVEADWVPPPLSPNVTVYYDGLEYPRGLKFDADGNLYVAEAGNSGDQEIKADTCPDFESPFMPYFMGNSSRVSRITSDGKRTTAIDKIPSARDPYDWTYGAVDVALMGDTVYALLQSGGCSRAMDDVPNGILRGNPDGTWSNFADLSAVLRANWPPKSPMDDDMEPDGMPYGLIAVDDKFYIVETNHGGLYEVNSDGKTTKLVDFTEMFSHIAPSVIAYRDGSLYVGNINALPTVVGAAKVFKVSPDGKVEVFAEGLTNILGLAFDDQGQLYVLEMSNGETEIPALGTGRVVRINTNGLRDVMATGLSSPAGITVGPDGALYVSQYSYDLEPGRAHSGKGQIVRIDVSKPLASRR
jgi:glucose/arabinose dehydrogenase